MKKKFTSLSAFLQEVRESSLRQVEIASRSVATTPPRGERVVYRGRVVVKAEGAGQSLEYVELVKPLAQASGAVGPTSDKGKAKLPRDASGQQRRLASQLRYYRESFEWRLAEARQRIMKECQAAGLAVAASEAAKARAAEESLPKPALGLKRLGE